MNYGQSYKNLSRNPYQFNLVLGLDVAVFSFFLPYFSKALDIYDSEYTMKGKKRERTIKTVPVLGIERKEDMLCFILSYLKNNTLQATHGANWGMLQPKANLWIHYLLPRVYEALEALRLLPCEDAQSYLELLESLLKDAENKADNQKLITKIDGMERQIQRPKHRQEQKYHYSGKKKTHTVKHIVISGENNEILCLGLGYYGSIHDKKLADEMKLVYPENQNLIQYQDTGFQGFVSDKISIIQPMKKPKNGQLTEQQKQNNKAISSERVSVEHAIGGMKILRIIKDEIRIYRYKIREMIAKIAAGIHNLKIKLKTETR